ncbi:STAS/SEC14 domain-containing protein [Reichenbachiella versicolor]|uniref:STAS/SEC14 domain-containing protein n=1 Tax=Reichenbachiella versicolor TaxID=1821036 RepID=UPI000D6DDF64|nr:STAS/SEC14 domain-containing protein [Reichenbachiella versicolor]
MPGLSVIQYKNQSILVLDYRGMIEDEIIETLIKAEELLMKNQEPNLNLTIISGVFATKRVMDQAFKLALRTQHLSKKGAIIGADGSKRIILENLNKNLYNDGLKPFENEEDALEYLTS